jgi:hypothetical protein
MRLFYSNRSFIECQQANYAFSIVFSKKRQRQGFRSFENQGVYSCK